MGIIHGLAMFLIAFGLIIIQCEAARIRRKQLTAPKAMAKIFDKAGFETFKTAVRARAVEVSDVDMDELLQNRIVKITPDRFNGSTIEEKYKDGNYVLEFGSFTGLDSFFRRFGEHVKQLEIYDIVDKEDLPRQGNYQRYIETCADRLEWLRVATHHDGEIWDALFSSDGHDMIFQNVKFFEYYGPCDRIEFNLSKIFPSLESIKIDGTLKDSNCLKGVTTLEELDLSWCEAIQENELITIFANNENLRNVSISGLNLMKTIESIATHLTKLVSLNVMNSGKNVLIRDDNGGSIHKLPSVTHFSIHFEDIDDFVERLPIDMPNLKWIELFGDQADNLIYLVHQFEKLECVEFLTGGDRSETCVENIKMNFDLTAWSLSHEENVDTDEKYLKFERQL